MKPVVSTTLHSSSRTGRLGFAEMRRDSWKSLQPWVSRGARKGCGQRRRNCFASSGRRHSLSCIRHHLEKQNGFEMWRLLCKENKPDTATRKVGLLGRVMDDQLAPGVDFSDWFLKWLDLVGDSEQARGRMIDDDRKDARMLKSSS